MKTRVLLIDDDPEEHEIFSTVLKTFNSRIVCVTANSWAESDLLVQHFLPDIIFLDMNMPLMTGIDTLKEIKKKSRLRDIPVYMYSTTASIGVKEALILGAVGWIKKPSLYEEYAQLFKEILNREESGGITVDGKSNHSSD